MLHVIIARHGREHARTFASLQEACRLLMWEVVEERIAVQTLTLRGQPTDRHLVARACADRCCAHHSANPDLRRAAMRDWQAALARTR